MLRLVFHFGRMRARADMEFEPRLKEYENEHAIRKQESQMRQIYNLEETEEKFEPFSTLLTAQKPRLQQQTTFKIDKEKLRKGIKNKYFDTIDKIQREQLEGVMDHRDYLEDKSHLYDQTEEIEFQKKFRSELFVRKETVLRVKKQVEKPENYLSESMNHDMNEYLEAKNQIKNIKVSQMLSNSKSNNFLQKIIESGLIDNPDKLKREIEAYQTRNSYEENQEQTSSPKLLTQHSTEVTSPDQKPETGIMEYTGLLEEIREQTQDQKSNIIKTIDLMSKVRLYEQRQFQQRYNAINFRFKGKVDFDFFTESELLSYIKHQKIEPKELLLLFDQNLNRVNRTNSNLIMTPAVISQVYTKTSLFRFPETKENNRFNMMAERSFAKLERMVFTNLDKIDNGSFADVVYSLSRNHEQEQGTIRPQQFDKIIQAVMLEFQDRVLNIEEAFLGAICRSLSRLPVFGLMKNHQKILDHIFSRIKGISEMYALESVCMFSSLVDSQRSKDILGQAINNFYYSSDWDHTTVVNTSKFFSSLLLGPSKDKYKDKLVEMYQGMSQDIPEIMQNVDFNNLAGVAAFFTALGFYDQKVWNSIKKALVDCLNRQKGMVGTFTVPTIISTIAYCDYHRKYRPQNIEDHSIINQFLVRKPIKYNSVLFRPYHESAKYLSDENSNTSLKGKLMIIKSLAFSGYNNQQFFDTFIYSTMKSVIDAPQNAITLAQLVHFHALLRRVNPLTEYMVEKIMSQSLLSQHPRVQVWIDYLVSLSNLFPSSAQLVQHAQNVYLKIQPFMWDIGNSQRIAVLASLVSLGINKSITTYQALSSIDDTKLSENEKYLMSLCLQLVADKSGKWGPLADSFPAREKEYYERVRQGVLQNEFAMGSAYSFQKIKKDFMSSETKEQKQVKQLPWRVETTESQKKTVYFFLTYDNLVRRESEQGNEVQQVPTGVWKMYTLLYQNLGYDVKIVQTFELRQSFQ